MGVDAPPSEGVDVHPFPVPFVPPDHAEEFGQREQDLRERRIVGDAALIVAFRPSTLLPHLVPERVGQDLPRVRRRSFQAQYPDGRAFAFAFAIVAAAADGQSYQQAPYDLGSLPPLSRLPRPARPRLRDSATAAFAVPIDDASAVPPPPRAVLALPAVGALLLPPTTR